MHKMEEKKSECLFGVPRGGRGVRGGGFFVVFLPFPLTAFIKLVLYFEGECCMLPYKR